MSNDVKLFEGNRIRSIWNNEKEFEDGIVRSYSYTVYLRANCRTFMIGDRIKIHLLEGIEREFSVKGFHRYQLQCKIWV